MGIKLSSPDLDKQNDGGYSANSDIGIESLIRIEVNSTSFKLTDSKQTNQSSPNLLFSTQQDQPTTLLKPVKHQRSQSIGKFILTSMITSNANVKNEDAVFDTLQNTKFSDSLNKSQIPTLNLSGVDSNQEFMSSINSDRKSSKSISTSLLNIGSSSSSSSSSMKTPRGTQFNIYSKLISGISNQEHLKRLQDCKLVLILGGVDSGKTTLMEILRDYDYKTEELKFYRDSILLYCIYCLKILVHSQHEVNLEEIQNTSPEFTQQFSDLIQQFQNMIQQDANSPRVNHLSNNSPTGGTSSKTSPNGHSPTNIFSLNSTPTSVTGAKAVNVSDGNSVSSSQQVLRRLWKQKEFFKVMDQLWKHPFVQKSYKERNSRKNPIPLLGENIEYFLNECRIEKLKKISQLTRDDIVRAKILSLESMPLKDITRSTIEDCELVTRKFLLLETFGWKEKRALYLPYLEKKNLHSIVFTVSLSDIDMMCFEELISPNKLDSKPTNRLLDSLYYFEQVLSKSELQQSNIRKVLVFTKVDSFIRKVSKGEASNSLSQYFSDYSGNRKNPKQVFQYIVDRFKSIQHRYSISYHNHYYGESNLEYHSSIVYHAINTLDEFDVNQVINSMLFNVKESYINWTLDSKFERKDLLGRRLLYKVENNQLTDVNILSSSPYSDLDYI